MLPVTAQEAVAAYNAGQSIEAVPILPGAPTAQNDFWREVFSILERFQMPAGRFTYSLAQFESWCFKESLSQPRANVINGVVSPLEANRSESIHATAFAILREGFSNVIERRAPSASGRITVKK